MTRGGPAVPANLAASLTAAYTIAPARHDNGHQDVMGMQNSMQVGRTVPQMRRTRRRTHTGAAVQANMSTNRLRKGKWSAEEEEFTFCVIRNFKRGKIPSCATPRRTRFDY